LRAYGTLLLEEADRQNLISAASRDQLWARHIVDSAQLLPMARNADGLWVDLGTGAGLPGIVIACLRPAPMLMIEARPLRVIFLQRCIDVLGLSHARVVGDKVERVQLEQPAAVISARAFAPMDRLLGSAAHFTDSSTLWLLPKGRNAQNELEIARRDWQASFHVEQSITDPESAIVTLSALSRKKASLQAPKVKKSGAQRRATWKANHR
jgi:16S rRNA (guanine527-N7)-methyltransferase